MVQRLIRTLMRQATMANNPPCGHSACAACCMGMPCGVHKCNGGK
ncbi:hypothetical protein KSD_71170 [Ktedonobacter sp. SOSP1-85]|nr:hypothetical protein KSD_71170 [Ktedonobacter sp. SOSP1-85]